MATDLRTFSTPAERLAADRFQLIVDKYDLRWAPHPEKRYPVGEMDWPPAGWFPVIKRLIVRLIRLGWDRHLAQAKEKFGGLRFYIGKEAPAVRAAIERAQKRSFKICDVCGAPGRQLESFSAPIRCVMHTPKRTTGTPTGTRRKSWRSR